MGIRTYIPTAIAILSRVCEYLIEYRETIEANTPDSGATAIAINAVLDACQALTDILSAARQYGD